MWSCYRTLIAWPNRADLHSNSARAWRVGNASQPLDNHSRTLPPQARVWTLVTAGFVESNLLLVSAACGAVALTTQCLVDVAAIIAARELLEPLWGSLEFLVLYYYY